MSAFIIMLSNSWVFFSLLTGLFLATVNIIDKYVLTRWIKNPMVLVLIVGILGLVPSLLFIVIKGIPHLSTPNILLTAAASVSFVFYAYFYFSAANIEEISRVVPLIYTAPLFISILASIFLHEIFAVEKYAGILILLVGAVLISSKDPIKIRLGKAFWLMMLASLAFSIYMVITKHLLNFVDSWTVFSLTRIGIFLALIPLFPVYLPILFSNLRVHGLKVLGVMTINEAFALAASLFIIIAASLGPVTLVNALSSVQPFFVLFFAVFLSFLYPSILKEEIGKSTLLLKLLAIVLIISGVVIIT
ncbi:EamA family transporter [Acidobacteriota bacterium]